MSSPRTHSGNRASADTGKNRLAQRVILAAYLVIWIAAVVVFWFFADPSDAMGFSVLFLWGLLPAATVVLSFLIGRIGCWGALRWLSPVIFGVMYLLAEYATFSAANWKTFGHVNSPQWGMLLAGAVLSAIGLGVGTAARRSRAKRKAREVSGAK